MMLTHPQDIPEEMGRLIRRWNSWRQKDIQSIAKFHSDFELIHPFVCFLVDEMKRTYRIIKKYSIFNSKNNSGL